MKEVLCWNIGIDTWNLESFLQIVGAAKFLFQRDLPENFLTNLSLSYLRLSLLYVPHF
jgi:hypothetical protein